MATNALVTCSSRLIVLSLHSGMTMPRDDDHKYKNPSQQRSMLSTVSLIVLALLVLAALCQLVFILASVHPPFDDIVGLQIVT